MAGEGSTTTTSATTVVTVGSPRPSVTRAPPTAVAADSSAASHFVGGAGLEEPSGGGGGGGGSGSGGGAVAVSAGMAVLNIGAGIAARVKAGIGGRVGRGGIRLGQRKRTRDQGDVAGGSGGERVGPPPPPQPAPVPAGGNVCPVCRRDDFPSFQSLSGHMKTHPERNWRGVNPPPTFSPDEFGDILAQFGGAQGGGVVAEDAAAGGGGDVIVSAAGGDQEAEVAVAVAETAGGQDGNAAARPVFDLNKSPGKEAGEPSSSSGKLNLDLNRSPPPPEA